MAQLPAPTADKPVEIPLPPNFQRELDALRRRNPGFDPVRDAWQMSKELRRWFERHRLIAA